MQSSTTNQGVNRPSFGAVFYFLSQYKLKYGIILVVSFAVSFLEGLGVAAFLPLFSTMLGDSSENLGGLGGFAAGMVDLIPVTSTFVAASLFLIGIFLIKTAGILGRDLLVNYVGATIIYDIKNQIIQGYSRGEYQYMVDNQQGVLIYNTLSTPASVGGLHLTLSKAINSLMKTSAIAIVLISIMPIPALAFLVLALVYYLAIHYVSKKITYFLSLGRVAASTEQTVIVNEFFNGFSQITAYNTGDRWLARFDQVNRTHRDLFYKEMAWQAVPRPLLDLSALGLLLGFVILLKVTNPETFAGELSSLGVFAVALVQILPSVNTLGASRLQLMAALPNVQIAHQTITQSVPPRREGHREIRSIEKGIAFENVSFAHKNRQTLMNEVNLTFKKGEVTAIVGPSGSGKTTMINLILGLFEPSGGQITVDGVQLQELTHQSWLGKIGFVSQDPFIYNTTIVENILFSRSSYSKEALIEAATIANAHDFISNLPQGFDTLVGDRGIRLSGGQQQRICIARAVLGSPEILIFDEATSSLDSLAEKQVQEAIDNASANRTVIIIAHRLSTIKRSDKIIVLDNGKVVEQGTHQELLENDGHYSRQVAASI